MTLTAESDSEEQARQRYFQEGEARALSLGNRGPLRFTKDGNLAPDIVEAYERVGFYVFESAIAPEELGELEADYLDLLERLPAAPGAKTDRHGRPALGGDLDLPVAHWGKPLADPAGGTARAQGRHPVKMHEPKPSAALPDKVIMTIASQLQLSDACLRLYGHPGLLQAAASLLGDDFTPFQEGIIVKRPGEGRSFAWHQDGTTHWDSPDWDQHIHGINIMPQLYSSTAANGVWYVPGTQMRHVDIKALAERSGGERLLDAVPLICAPGDVAFSNRQVLHGSFANTSPDPRVTLGFGLLPRRGVLGAKGYPFENKEPITYDAEWIRRRSEVIGYAIDARRRRYPNETPYTYQPHAKAGQAFHWDAAGREAIRNYNKYDIRT